MEEKSKLEEDLKRLELKGNNLHIYKNLFNNCLEVIEFIIEVEENLGDDRQYQDIKNDLHTCKEKYFSLINKLFINKQVDLSEEIRKYEENS